LFSSPEKSAVCLILDQPSRRNFYRHSNSVLTELSRGLEATCSHHSTLSLDSPPPLSAIRATSIYSIVSSERVETEQLSPLRSLCCGMRTLFPTTSELVRQMPSQTIKSRKEPPFATEDLSLRTLVSRGTTEDLLLLPQSGSHGRKAQLHRPKCETPGFIHKTRASFSSHSIQRWRGSSVAFAS
jgi:hypothetical protein